MYFYKKYQLGQNLVKQQHGLESPCKRRTPSTILSAAAPTKATAAARARHGGMSNQHHIGEGHDNMLCQLAPAAVPPAARGRANVNLCRSFQGQQELRRQPQVCTRHNSCSCAMCLLLYVYQPIGLRLQAVDSNVTETKTACKAVGHISPLMGSLGPTIS